MREPDTKILAEIRAEVCDTVLKWTTVLGLAAVAASLSRLFEFGFLPIMALHVGLAALLVAVYLARARIAYLVRAGVIVGTMMAVAVAGHVAFGTPMRMEFFISASIMGAVFFGERIGIAITAASLILLGLIYASFASGLLAAPVPVPSLSASNWLTNGASMVMAALAPLLAVTRFRVYLNRERELAAAANRAKTAFLATMSHELRTPMTAILGMSDILLADTTAGPAKDVVARISKAGRTLLNLLNDILDFSKVEANAVVIVPAPFHPRELIEDIRHLFEPMAREKGVEIELILDSHVHETLVADAGRLRQAVVNLVGNAVKFTERGKIAIRGSQESTSTGLKLTIEVSDTGIGIPFDLQARLFQPFVQGDKGGARQYGGTGLGLAITRRMIELMGGTISLRSEPNVGSTFTLSIPVELPPAVSAAAAADSAVTPGESICLRLLVVDDNEPIRFLMTAMLRKLGHTVDVAVDGREAVAAVQNNPYDAVLMDMQMPGMDGDEATRVIRALGGEAGRVPIIAVTADVVSENREHYLGAGVTALIGKPVNWNELSRLLKAHCASGRNVA